jgi:serpin B
MIIVSRVNFLFHCIYITTFPFIPGENSMKIRGPLAVALLISTVLIAGCLDNGGTDKDPPGYESQFVPMNDLVNSSNEFSFGMYRELIDGDENVFFSPYSITIALGMAYEGARGETAEEMIDVIEFSEDNEARRTLIRSLQSALNPEGANYELSTANAYWLRQGGDLNGDYQYSLENDYLAHGQELDFGGDPIGSADTINDWVESETNDRIKDLVDPDLLDGLTYLVLTNAIYFKANWRWQFDEDATEERTFHLSDGSTKMVDTMNMCDEEIDLNYAENDDVQMLQLPYKDEELSMYILLPKGNDISTMETDLDREYLDDLKSDMYGEWVDVYLPKFKFELKYDLIPPLKDMGMNRAFGSGADFSGIKESGDSDLYISDVIHQSFVEVNEEGTEAAAATAVIMTERAPGPSEPQPVTFRADDPFIFFIEHQQTGQILFMGKVEDPTA